MQNYKLNRVELVRQWIELNRERRALKAKGWLTEAELERSIEILERQEEIHRLEDELAALESK